MSPLRYRVGLVALMGRTSWDSFASVAAGVLSPSVEVSELSAHPQDGGALVDLDAECDDAGLDLLWQAARGADVQVVSFSVEELDEADEWPPEAAVVRPAVPTVQELARAEARERASQHDSGLTSGALDKLAADLDREGWGPCL